MAYSRFGGSWIFGGDLDRTSSGWTEVTPLTGKYQEIFVAAVFAFNTGKAVVQIAAIEIAG